ncbi:hypothetical protein D1872_215410 [compost metagenome]
MQQRFVDGDAFDRIDLKQPVPEPLVHPFPFDREIVLIPKASGIRPVIEYRPRVETEPGAGLHPFYFTAVNLVIPAPRGDDDERPVPEVGIPALRRSSRQMPGGDDRQRLELQTLRIDGRIEDTYRMRTDHIIHILCHPAHSPFDMTVIDYD